MRTLRGMLLGALLCFGVASVVATTSRREETWDVQVTGVDNDYGSGNHSVYTNCGVLDDDDRILYYSAERDLLATRWSDKATEPRYRVRVRILHAFGRDWEPDVVAAARLPAETDL